MSKPWVRDEKDRESLADKATSWYYAEWLYQRILCAEGLTALTLYAVLNEMKGVKPHEGSTEPMAQQYMERCRAIHKVLLNAEGKISRWVWDNERLPHRMRYNLSVLLTNHAQMTDLMARKPRNAIGYEREIKRLEAEH